MSKPKYFLDNKFFEDLQFANYISSYQDVESQYQKLEDQLSFLNLAQNKKAMRDGTIMMEGVLDHSQSSTPTEYFLSTYINPYKLSILGQYTALGYRICYEFEDDVFSGGLGVELVGTGVEDDEKYVNQSLYERQRELNFLDKMSLGGGISREQGDALIVLYYEGEYWDNTVGKNDENVSLEKFQYLAKEAPVNGKVAAFDVFNPGIHHWYVWKDDGRGHPTAYKLNPYLGKAVGEPTLELHHSRVIQISRKRLQQGFTSHSEIIPCYNELVIETNILKSMGEYAFREGTGKYLILTKGLGLGRTTQFKTLLGNPTRDSWFTLPSEMIEDFSLMSKGNSAAINLPELGDYCIGKVVASVGIPRPILMGEVSGVVTGGEVNERTYFATLNKEQVTLENPIYQFYLKDRGFREILSGYSFRHKWGTRLSLSAQEQADLDTKRLANLVTKAELVPINTLLEEMRYPKLEQMVDPEFKEYARKLGNSALSFTYFDMEQMKLNAEIQKQRQAQITQGKTVQGNEGKGKGQGAKWREKRTSQPQGPTDRRKAKSVAASRVKGKISDLLQELRDPENYENRFSRKELAEVFGLAPGTIDKLLNMRDDYDGD